MEQRIDELDGSQLADVSGGHPDLVVEELAIIVALLRSLESRWPLLDDDSRKRELSRISQQAAGFLAWADPAPQVPAPGALAHLTRREMQVLRTLADGASTLEIAKQLDIAPSTVRNYVKNIFTKLEVHSRVEAVCQLLKAGMARFG